MVPPQHNVGTKKYENMDGSDGYKGGRSGGGGERRRGGEEKGREEGGGEGGEKLRIGGRNK